MFSVHPPFRTQNTKLWKGVKKQVYLIVKGPSYEPKLFQKFLHTILDIFF